MKTRKLEVGVVVVCLILLSVQLAGAAIDAILISGKVTVGNLSGTLQFTSNPYTSWTPTLSIQSGAIWRSRVQALTMQYTGTVTVTWALFDCGPDGVIGSQDDLVIPDASFGQNVTVVSGVSQDVVASSDGFNPYNWGQWTTSPIQVYLQAEVTGS